MSRFWKNKKVLVTGHTGFKGSWLTIWLNQLGANVVGYSLNPEIQPAMFTALNLDEICDSHIADIRDLNKLSETIKITQPDIVFHMAAQSLVLTSYENPTYTYATNVMGTVNILEATRQSNSIQTIINITTDKVYENSEKTAGYNESDRLGGHDPYSNSKACSELVSESYRNSFLNTLNKRVVTCRAGNVIGGGDWCANRLIPDSARAFAQNEKVIVRNPQSVRPWQHVIEPLRAYLIIAEKAFKNELKHNSYNIGPRATEVATVEHVLNLFTQFWPRSAGWTCLESTKKPHETAVLALQTERAENELNWQPKLNLDKALQITAEWYQAYYKLVPAKNLLSLTQDQIQRWGGELGEFNK